MRATDLIKGNIAYHDRLNPEVWDGAELRVDVRYKLLEITKRFVEYLEVPNFKLSGVLLRGSLANYNYTPYSDFDLHLVTDYSILDCDITEQFYLAKKKIWNDEHDITIKGYEVELYVEDIGAKNVSAGTYNILDNEWVSQPQHKIPEINDSAVAAKARDLIKQINRAVKTGSVEDLDRLKDKIKTMRQAGLDQHGEFSTENLAFKILRNKGYMDKLYKAKTVKFDQELSLDEGLKSSALMAALVAALSASPAQAQTQDLVDPKVGAQAISIMHMINNFKNYNGASLEGEARQELNNILRTIGGHPNQSKLYPIIKKAIEKPEQQELPPLLNPEDQPK
jgi:hypothetical protein